MKDRYREQAHSHKEPNSNLVIYYRI
ncbi:hypothetical protein EMIT0196MI5_50020 [Pseudomonas sp. IT-196MI5]